MIKSCGGFLLLSLILSCVPGCGDADSSDAATNPGATKTEGPAPPPLPPSSTKFAPPKE